MSRLLLLASTLFYASMALAQTTLTVYSGRSEALVGPLFESFKQAHPEITLDVRYNSTPAITTQLLAEQAQSPADVVFLQESGYLSVLAQADLLQTLDDTLLEPVQTQLQASDGQWVGTSARARVLAYNTDKVKPEELPESLQDLTDEKWQGRISWAPSNASMQAHVNALRVLWGEEATQQWLAAMKANKPVSYPRNAVQVTAIDQGEVDIGWVNHYYLHVLKKQNPDLKVANYSFPEDASGNVLIISGAGIYAHSKNTEAAEQLLAFLVAEQAQQYFANESFEYPTRKGVATHQDVPALETITFADVDQKDLADVQPTLQMLQGLGLL